MSGTMEDIQSRNASPSKLRLPPGLQQKSPPMTIDIDSAVGPPSPMARRIAQVPFAPAVMSMSPSIAPSPVVPPSPAAAALQIAQAEQTAAMYASAAAQMQQCAQYAATCAFVQAQQMQAQQLHAQATQQLPQLRMHKPLSLLSPTLAPVSAPVVVSIEPMTEDVSPSKRSERFVASPKRDRPKPVKTLSTSLQLLSEEDPDCLFIIRRINKLGFKASRTIKQHFSQHGQVVRVLVAHSSVRQSGDPNGHVRRRPSSLGFVQMATAEAVSIILALGAEQEVDGVIIKVQKFERHYTDEIGDEDELVETSPSRSPRKNRGTSLSEATTADSFLMDANPMQELECSQ